MASVGQGTKVEPAERGAMRLELAAVAALHRVGRLPWYDANFLRLFEAAKLFLTAVQPGAVARFVDGFAPLRTRKDFVPVQIGEVFAADVFQKLRETVAGLELDRLELHERGHFGRHVLHGHAWFTALQQDMAGRVSELAGEELAPSYNFLSLYAEDGRCPPHMDEPLAKWTFDICIEQTTDWPIHVSQPVDWPDLATMTGFSSAALRADPALRFTPTILQPNSAVLFAGSSQWHYREAIGRGNHCHLLFFHYYPAGCESLVHPARWADHFDLPQLDVLVTLDGKLRAGLPISDQR